MNFQWIQTDLENIFFYQEIYVLSLNTFFNTNQLDYCYYIFPNKMQMTAIHTFCSFFLTSSSEVRQNCLIYDLLYFIIIEYKLQKSNDWIFSIKNVTTKQNREKY